MFLGNTDPSIQLRVLDQVENPRFVLVDSMDFWIDGDREQVARVFERCDCVVLNDEEVRLFGGHANIPRAVRKILDLGPTYVVVKRGEFGAALVSKHGWFFRTGLPAGRRGGPHRRGRRVRRRVSWVAWPPRAQPTNPPCARP